MSHAHRTLPCCVRHTAVQHMLVQLDPRLSNFKPAARTCSPALQVAAHAGWQVTERIAGWPCVMEFERTHSRLPPSPSPTSITHNPYFSFFFFWGCGDGGCVYGMGWRLTRTWGLEDLKILSSYILKHTFNP